MVETTARALGDPLHRVLVLFAHPALEKSRVNQVLIRGLDRLPGTTFHDLYETYPDFDVDVEREQALLLEHDVIVLHHPFFWYSTPALVKQWEDLVLEHGWAYGKGGTALAGKTMLSAITTGGRQSAYLRGGHNRYTIVELLRPIEQTAVLCGLEYLPPFVVHGTHGIRDSEIEAHAADYHRVLSALSRGALDLEAARQQERLNADLDAVIRE
ncbi:MAG: NAD(P)H-dependent oxidoreductase [Myxococcales bacterium]|jgi:glutathione-regulated potassium-efflux system ancillary protein KefG